MTQRQRRGELGLAVLAAGAQNRSSDRPQPADLAIDVADELALKAAQLDFLPGQRARRDRQRLDKGDNLLPPFQAGRLPRLRPEIANRLALRDRERPRPA